MPKIRATTQDHIDVEEVVDDLILLKDGTSCLVLQTNAINFGLLSEEEQDATIYAYAALLNSLTFTIQILIRSESKDITSYVKLLEEQEIRQLDTLKREQINSYKNFISALVQERNVLEKKFYLVIPFTTLELGVGKSVSGSFNTKKSLPFDKSYILEKAKQNLEPRRDHLYRQLGRLGLAARQLTTQELIRLLFSMYNPGSTQGQKISNTQDYTVPLVQPAYINPKEAIMSDTTPNPTPSPTTPPATGTTPEPTTPATPSPAAPATPSPAAPSPMGSTPEPAAPTTPEPTTPATPSPAAPATPSPAAPSPMGSTPEPAAPTTTPDSSETPADAQQAINSAASDLTGSNTSA